MSPPGAELSIRALAKALGLDHRGVSRDVRRGMPRDIQGALQWRLAYVRPQKGTRRPSLDEARARVEPPSPKVVVAFDYANAPASDESDEDLAVCISRLRRLERTCAQSLERCLREGRIAESQALRREHSTLVKNIFDTSSKLLRLQVDSGKLVTLDTALRMISDSLAPVIIQLRRLPDLARDPADRPRFEAFLNAVLNEMKDGAEASLKGSGVLAR